jgi:hypothetical protein
MALQEVHKKVNENNFGMNVWVALGFFLLGAGVGALTTAIHYSAQMRDLRLLVQATAASKGATRSAAGQERKRRQTKVGIAI